MVDVANIGARDFETDGVASSGKHKIKKSWWRAWGTYLESIIAAGTLSDAVWKATQSLLNADLAHAADTIGVVYDDSTAANNGLYKKVGGSGSGSWTQLSTFLPGYQFVTGTDNSSTANAIAMDTSPALPAGDGVALVSFVIPITNTSSTVTVAFDGGTALAVKTAAGNDVVIGGLVAGMPVLGVVAASGTQFRLRSDQAASAIQQAAENAQSYAEEWANKAEDALVTAAAGGDEVDDYSALHWSKKAEAFKNQAEAAAAAAAQKFFPVTVLDVNQGAPATDYEAGDTIDGIVLTTGNIVLRSTAGGDPADGAYTVPASGAATRVAQFADYDDFPGAFFSVTEGTTYEDTVWRVTSDEGGTIDVTDIVITQFTSAAGGTTEVATRAALKGVDTSQITSALLREAGREGLFVWDSSDLSAEVTLDTVEALYVAKTGEDGSTGAWRRIYTGPVDARWGGVVADGVTDNRNALNILFANTDIKWLLLPIGEIRHGALTLDREYLTVQGHGPATLLNYNATTGDNLTVGNASTETREVHLKDFDMWAVAAKSSGWAIKFDKWVRGTMYGVNPSSLTRVTAAGGDTNQYNGLWFNGFDRSTIDEFECFECDINVKCNGIAPQVYGAELHINRRAMIGGADTHNLQIAGSANVYFRGEIGAGFIGVRIDTSETATPNREIWVIGLIDGCEATGLDVQTDSVFVLEMQDLWCASCGTVANGAAGIEIKPSAGVARPRINATGSTHYNHVNDACILNACQNATFTGSHWSLNGGGSNGGRHLRIANSGAGNVVVTGASMENVGNGTLGVGIQLDAGVDRAVIVGCCIRGSGTAAISDGSGTGTSVIANNVT